MLISLENRAIRIPQLAHPIWFSYVESAARIKFFPIITKRVQVCLHGCNKNSKYQRSSKEVVSFQAGQFLKSNAFKRENVYVMDILCKENIYLFWIIEPEQWEKKSDTAENLWTKGIKEH